MKRKGESYHCQSCNQKAKTLHCEDVGVCPVCGNYSVDSSCENCGNKINFWICEDCGHSEQ